jgi:hypothetical protein
MGEESREFKQVHSRRAEIELGLLGKRFVECTRGLTWGCKVSNGGV